MLTGIATLGFLIRFPLTEGRAENLDTFDIYSDPFILYAYAVSTVFFFGLYKAYKLLAYIGQDKLYSQASVKALRSIRNCAIILAVCIVMAGIYIRLFHHVDDDPAGFLALSILATLIFVAIALVMARIEKGL